MPAHETRDALRRLLLAALAALPDERGALTTLVASNESIDPDDWRRFIEAAGANGVLGILTPLLRRLSLAEDVRGSLERRAIVQSMWHERLMVSLRDVV